MKNKTDISHCLKPLCNFNLLSGLCRRSLPAICILTLYVTMSSATFAQNVQYTNLAIDHGMRNHRRVNPVTRGVEFQIPLGYYKGRGGLDVPVTLSYSSKLWNVKFQGHNPGAPPPHGGLLPFTIVTAEYSKHSVAGWTSSIGFPTIDFQPGDQMYDSGGNPNVSGNCTAGCFKIDRIMVWMPDGSGHELRSTDQPRPTTQSPPDDLYSVDGSRLRYQRSTGTLFMPDGSRYLIGAGKFIDRNGNTLTWVGGWQDTLGRTINNPLGAPPATPGDQNYSLPGVGNTTINYTLKWLRLQDALTTPQPVRHIANSGCPPETGGSFSPSLFFSDTVTRTCFGNASVVFNPMVLSQIVLPNGQTYTFTYDVYGAIDKVLLPTGGYEKYPQAHVPPISSPLNIKVAYAQANRGVTTHTISPTGLAADEQHWQYSGTTNSVSVTAPDGTRSESFLWTDGVSNWGYSADSSRAGRAYDERVYTASGQMIRRKLTQWAITGSNDASGSFSGTQVANRNPRITRMVEFILDTGGGPALAKSTTYTYDTTFEFNVGIEQTSISEFDYVTDIPQSTAQTLAIGSIGSIPNGTPLRTTEIEYLTSNINYRSRHMLSMPTVTRVKNGSGVVVSKFENFYDEAAFSLLTYPTLIGWTDPATSFRGNVTTVTRWLNFDGVSLFTFPSGSNLAKHTQYDQSGSIRAIWDARDGTLTNPALIDYSPTFHRAYATTVTSPDPDGAGPRVPLTSSTEYDFSTGLITATVDPNSQRTTFDYTDPMNRLKQTVRAASDNGAKNQTTYIYDDVNRTLTTTSDLNLYNDNVLKIVTLYDGLGRLQERQLHEGGGNYVAVQQQYDAFGRTFKTSNPFRPLQGESALWTTKVYDPLDRLLSITSPDNAVVSKSYNGNSATITDQAGKQRRNVWDSFGRIKQVIEAPNDPLFQYVTTYDYDAHDKLTHVTQGGQHRYFMYDSLSRLIRTRNPEQATNPSLNLSDPLTLNLTWSYGYQYDANANVTQKIDPRGVTTALTYDSLNRNTGISYSNDPSGTLPVTFVYDTAANGKGQLHTAQTTGAAGSLMTVAGYDALGRPLTLQQQFFVNGAWGPAYTMQRTYNLAGRVASQTYPSGRTITHAYDSAGRTASFAGNLGDGTQRTYSNEIIYSPFGSLAKEKFGTTTSIYNKLFYNNRGQLAEIRESTTYTGPNDTSVDRGGIVNHFSDQCAGKCTPTSSMTDNNGNLRKQEVLIPNQTTRVQEYNYDPINRLKWARELLSGVEQWKQEFTYDRWGNRTVNIGTTYGINEKEFTVNTNNNRLGVPVGQTGTMGYDNAGNLTTDTYSGAGNLTYDAENRTTAAFGNNFYTYSASGQRVRRSIAGAETWQIYGFDGELLAEYPANGAVISPKKEYGYRNGQLLVTAETSATGGGGGGGAQSVIWTNPVGVSISGNNLTRTLAGDAWNAGATSSQSIASGDGYVEFTASETNKKRAAGLTDSTTVTGFQHIDYGILLGDNGTITIQEGVAVYGVFGTYTTGDVLRVAVEGGVVKYRKNGTLLRTSTLAPTYPLYAGAALFHNGTTVTNAQRSGSGPQNVLWTNPVGVSISGNNLTRTLAGDAWNAGATSSQSLTSGDGYVEFTASETNKKRAAGLTDSTTVTGFQHIDYGILLGDNGTITIQEGVAVYGVFGTYTTGDVLRVAVEGGVVKYRKNGTLLRTSTLAPTYPLYAGAALFHNGTTITNAILNSGGGASSSTQINWLVPDHLGTPRIVFDATGDLANAKRHDYLPFGEELFGGTAQSPGPGGRLTTQGYASGDGVRQQFTGQERDAETGLDYFNARYYSSMQGRFTSPDPFGGSGFVTVPQSWNKYTYVLNRPYVFTDPSGLIWLTKDDRTFIWVEDAEYEKNKEKWKDYSVANGAVTRFRGSKNCPQCKGIALGQWVRLEDNGDVTEIADPTTTIYGSFIYTEEEINSPVPVITGTVWYKELQGGPKNGSRTYHNDKGGRTIRWYDNNGRAWIDIDYGHDHGAGDPHIHWWDWTGLKPERSRGEPVPESFDWVMWDNGDIEFNPNRQREMPVPFTIPVTPMDGSIPVRPTAPVRPMVPVRPMIPLRPIIL